MRTMLILAGLALALAGCNQPAPSTADAGTDSAAATAAEPMAAPETQPTEVGADYQLDTAIPKEKINTALTLAAPPAYRASDDTLLLQVNVQNHGDAALVGRGKKPVQLAATLAGPDGVDKAPGVRDFVRVRLPLVQPGGEANVRVRIPAAKILGLDLKLELVQETVAWFGRRYGQPGLDVGVFQRCDGAAATLCDASGTPVRAAEPKPGAPATEPAAG